MDASRAVSAKKPRAQDILGQNAKQFGNTRSKKKLKKIKQKTEKVKNGKIQNKT